MSSRVLRAESSPVSDAQRALAAVLDTGPDSALHGPTALAWYGLRGFDLREIHVARARAGKSRTTTLGQLHHLRDLRSHDVLIVRGVPTESALRAIWSESSRYSPEPLFEWGMGRIGRLLDDAHTMHLITWNSLHEMVDDIHERGRSGSTIMRALAQERPVSSSPTESRNEDKFEEILRSSGVRPLKRQVPVGGREPVGRADFSDDLLPLVVEINSLTYHSTPSDRAADEHRYQRLCEEGFTVAVVWEDDLWSRRRPVVDLVREGRQQAGRARPMVLHSPGCPWPDDDGLPVHRFPRVPALAYRG